MPRLYLDFPCAMNEIEMYTKEKNRLLYIGIVYYQIGIISSFDNLFFMHTLDIINSERGRTLHFKI